MKARNEFKAGVFVVATLALFAASIWVMGQERQIFSSQEEYKSIFSSAGGLAKGAPVRLGGLAIGRVSKIGFSEDLKDPSIHVVLLINEEFLERVREDSVATIETQGLLGDKFVSVTPGVSKKQLLPGSTIPSAEQVELQEVLKGAQAIVANAVDISKTVKEAVNEVKPRISTTLEAIDSGARNLTEVFGEAQKIITEVKDGTGMLHSLVYGDEKTNVAETLKNLNDASLEIKDAAGALTRGEGTLGALLTDSQVYDNVVEITDGAKRSFILRQAIKSARNEVASPSDESVAK